MPLLLVELSTQEIPTTGLEVPFLKPIVARMWCNDSQCCQQWREIALVQEWSNTDLRNISAKTSCVMWREERLWNVRVLHRVCLSNLVLFYSDYDGRRVTWEKCLSQTVEVVSVLYWCTFPFWLPLREATNGQSPFSGGNCLESGRTRGLKETEVREHAGDWGADFSV
jgi:hypothetical protein